MRPVKLLFLIIVLNVIRYVVIGWVEGALILPPLFETMAQGREYFNQEFTTVDWVTSYGYNFFMWATVVFVYFLLQPHLRGNHYVKSLEVFCIMWVFFAAVSAIYMNHYSHPKSFYVWNIIDAFLVYGLLALANGWLYPRIMRERPAPA